MAFESISVIIKTVLPRFCGPQCILTVSSAYEVSSCIKCS